MLYEKLEQRFTVNLSTRNWKTLWVTV